MPLHLGYKMLFGRHNIPRKWCLFWDTKNFFGDTKTLLGYKKLFSRNTSFWLTEIPKHHKNYKYSKIMKNQKKEEKDFFEKKKHFSDFLNCFFGYIFFHLFDFGIFFYFCFDIFFFVLGEGERFFFKKKCFPFFGFSDLFLARTTFGPHHLLAPFF